MTRTECRTMQALLAIETTCDETAAAVITRDLKVLASKVAGQEAVHERFDGVVPELAARAHLERIVPIIRGCLAAAAIDPIQDLAAVAVATEPGLPGSLLVGLAAAKGLCVAWDKPLIAVNHVQAHIYACQLGRTESIFPCLGFVVSGGHTNFYECRSAIEWQYLGGTIDDAVGEAFDKVAVMLGLPYPGGPHISRIAATGNPKAHSFPRPMLDNRQSLNLSFSGLKTAVRYALVGAGKQDFSALQLNDQQRADVAASFETAAIECLVGKTDLALKQTGLKRLCVGGGVCANRKLREELQRVADKRRVELLLAPPELCTDNAVMGAIAWEQFDRGNTSPLDIDIHPGLVRGVSR
ncbi:MAG: tRNA (adenosine(37)-N6)-threonylcarbamoyltransferase complex transferase subunit TsaD [Pirellulales bacterium]